MFNQLPKPLLVFLVLAGGVLLLFFLQKPVTVCDSQLEVFKEAQKGKIFPSAGKAGQPRPPMYSRMVQQCKEGNSPGACFELFGILRDLLRDLERVPRDCQVTFGEDPAIKRALVEGAELMVRLAWGEIPPEREAGAARFGWLESADLALFCRIRDQFVRMFGPESWDQFRVSVHGKLPGDKPIFENGSCLNCLDRKSAAAVFSAEEIWVRSIFSIRCEQYR